MSTELLLQKLQTQFPNITFTQRTGFIAVDDPTDINQLRTMFPYYSNGEYLTWNKYFTKLLSIPTSVDLYSCSKAVIFAIN